MIDPHVGGTRLRVPFDWHQPDYAPIYQDRADRLKRLRANPSALPALRQFYAANPAAFISDWGMTSDPRNIERGLPALTPFILFPKQIEFIEWVMARWRAGENGLCEKSRDCGASWLLMSLACTLALFNDGLTVNICSRKEDLLDRSGDPSTLFHKGRTFLESLPREFLGAWDSAKHAPHMRLIFAANGSAVVGESGDQIGRGARAALALVDESAFIPNQATLDASLAATSNCVIHVSSVNGLANGFAQKRFSGRIPVFTFHWRDDPRKSEEWYQRQVATLDPVVIASEYDLDYRGSVEGVLIPSAWIQAAIGAHLKLGISPSGARRGGFDVADEGADKNAVAIRHGILLQHLESWSGKGGDIYQSTVKAFDICDRLECQYLFFDSDGLGSAVRGDARIINEKREAADRPRIFDEPFRGSASPTHPDREMVPKRKNRDFFANAKAQAWWSLRLRFQEAHRALNGLPYDADALISIDPNLSELAALTMELSQPTYSLNSSGKILIDKQPDGMKSPNLADALTICFNPSDHSAQLWAAMAD